MERTKKKQKKRGIANENIQNDFQLLDNCVKNCGYPFHLQIATKEFLNELVRKFPERPAVSMISSMSYGVYILIST